MVRTMVEKLEDCERERDEARAIARRLRADLRQYDKIAQGYTHLQKAAAHFDALPWAKEKDATP